MAVFLVVVIVWAIQIGRHHAAVVAAMLAVIAFAQLDPGDLGDGVGLIGRFEDTGEQCLFFHRLLGMLGVDAR
ncbi:hypothetical protein D9M68_575470 [compost metagenome]